MELEEAIKHVAYGVNLARNTFPVEYTPAIKPKAIENALETTVKQPPFALIMKGGGIKGLAYVGAIEHLSQHHTFNWYVGTSAGAVAAVLLGAGYNAVSVR